MTLIYSSNNSFYALCKDSHLYATGWNEYGQLGTRDNDDKIRLTLMEGLPGGATALQVVCGKLHTVVLGDDGLCYATGWNDDGQLGTSDKINKTRLTLMEGLPPCVTALRAVCGFAHTVVLRNDGLCYATGWNEHGQLGTGDKINKTRLTLMRGLTGGVTALQVVCGRHHTVVLGSNGCCYATGCNDYGQLGTRDKINKTQLTLMEGLPPYVTALQVVCSDSHTVVRGSNGLCYATGFNNYGQLGTGYKADTNQLTLMQGLPEVVKALHAVCSGYCTVVIGSNGLCYATGWNDYGQLGTGDKINKTRLTLMEGLPPYVTALQVVCSDSHTVVLGTDGRCYATGWNDKGQLGTGDDVDKIRLTLMEGLTGGVTALQVVCGDYHTVVLGTDSRCYATGWNDSGQLGTGDDVDKIRLTLMEGLPIIIQQET